MNSPDQFLGEAQETEVIIIGAGIVGVCTALFLQRRGVGVTLVDMGRVGSGSSHGNAGLLVPSHAVPLAEPAAIRHGLRWLFNPASPFYIKPRLDADLLRWLWRFWRAATPARVEAATPVLRDLHLASRALFAEFAADGLDFGYQEQGRLLLCHTAAGLDEAVHEAQHMGQFGIDTDILDAAACVAHLQGLQCDVEGGVLYPQDGHLEPARCVAAIAARAVAEGTRILEDTEVLGWRLRADHIDTVVTTRGDFRPRQVVIASGSWTPALTRDLEIAVPIQPAKGYSVTIAAPDDTPTTPFMLTEAKVGVTPLPDTEGRPTGRVRFAGTLELAGMDMSFNRRRVAALTAAVPRYLPQWSPSDFVVEEVWRGLRPCTPDGLPMLGRPRRWNNLVIAAGHAMIGISLGAITGDLAARMATGVSTDPFDLRLLDPDRFTH